LQIEASLTVTLPFTLDFCAEGPNVPPLTATIDGVDIAINFPPSMSDGADGQSFYPSGWAWWKGHALLVDLARVVTADDLDSVEDVRKVFGDVADEALRRFLNAYRVRLTRPDVHPVRIDRMNVQLVLIGDDGSTEALPEPVSAFFYNQMPHEAPLNSSLNSTNITALEADVRDGNEPSLASQLALDAAWLESLGEVKRAEALRRTL
jgi:hypothetical protein